MALCLSDRPIGSDFSHIVARRWPPRLNYAVVRAGKGEIRPVLDLLEKTCRKISPDFPINIKFVDDTINSYYLSEQRWGKIVNFASVFTILIAAFGLFGLSLISAEKRIKEIGIRKVLGASTFKIVTLVSKDLIILVLLANIFAWPAAYFVINNWLQNFAYKTNINPWVFILSGVFALVIAFITVSFQVVKASTTNPVEALKYE